MTTLLEIKEKECYQRDYFQPNPNDTYCELIFDGLMCWNPAKADTVAVQLCPDYISRNLQNNATRQCMENGQWFVHPEYQRMWTDYSQCNIVTDESTGVTGINMTVEYSVLFHTWFPIIKTVTHCGYGISLTALLLALIIFLSIRKLQCARNRLHMHLFVSFIMRAVMSLVKDLTFVEGIAMQSDIVTIAGRPKFIKQHYTWLCKAIVSTRNYFIIANYMMVLMEGIYLHNLMFLTLFSDNSQITIYYLLGWGIPAFFIATWVSLRIYFEDVLCWTTSDNKHFSLLIQIPMGASVVVSFILFLMIVRILFVKLNTMYIQHRKSKYRRLMRSTLILVPLFGVPYVISLIIYAATSNKVVELLWIFFDQTFTAFQGFFVALIYCLLNSEVHVEIKQKYNSFRNKHGNLSRSRTISHTQQFPTMVIPLQEELLGTNGYAANENEKRESKTTTV